MMSGMACHHIPRTTHTVERSRVWHAIIALILHTRTDDVKHGMSSWYLTTHTFGRRRSWHEILTLGKYKRSDDIGLGIP